MSHHTGQSLFFALVAPFLVAQSACAPIYARSFSARLADPHTFVSVCPSIESHAAQRSDAIRRGCSAPAGPDGADAFIARQGERVTYRIDAAAGGQELTYLIRTRAPSDMSWGSDNAEAELDLLEAEHRAVLERAVDASDAAAADAGAGEPPVDAGTAGGSGQAAGDGSRSAGEPPGAGDSAPADAQKGATFKVAGIISRSRPEVPEQLFGLIGGLEVDGARLGLRFWTSESFGLDFGGSFLATSVNDATALRLGGNGSLLIALASANDARLYLQPEVGMTILAADGADSTIGFHLGLALGAEYLIARRGLPVIGLSARVMAGIERASVTSPIVGLEVDATSFGLIGGGVGVTAYFNKP